MYSPYDHDHDKEPANAPIDLEPVGEPDNSPFCEACFSSECVHCIGIIGKAKQWLLKAEEVKEAA